MADENGGFVLAAVLAFLGYMVVYSAVKDERPWDEVVKAFGGTTTPFNPLSGTVADAVASGVNQGLAGEAIGSGVGAGIGCSPPGDLVTDRGVTLRASAMASYNAADTASGGQLRAATVSTYRDCTAQRAACQRICGNPDGGCPGRCAKPGTSYHQRGQAVDLQSTTLGLTYLVPRGWCHPLPATDPGHFSFGGCH